jgi:hypothetical protein
MEAKLEGNILTVKMTLGKGERSHSGKSTLMFSTKGFIKIEGSDNLQISINVIKSK